MGAERNLSRRSFLGLAGGTSVLLALGACGSSSSASGDGAAAGAPIDADVQSVFDSFVSKQLPGVPVSLVQAAKREGSVSWYHTTEPVWTKMVTDFNSVFSGIVKASELSISSGQALAKIEAEVVSGSPLVDLWLSSDANLANQLVTAGQVTQYTPSVASNYPASSNKSGYYYPAFRNTMVSAWNSTKVTDTEAAVLATWDGILRDDIWTKHRVGAVDPSAGPGTSVPAFYLQQKYGASLWSKLARYPNHVYSGAGPAYDALASGEVDVILFSSDAPALTEVNAGAPVKFVYPTPTLFTPPAQLIVKNAKHPNAAKLLDEFVLSQYGQELANKNGQATYFPGITDTRTFTKDPWYKAPSESNLATYDQAAYVKALPSLTKSWESAYKTG